MCCVFLETLDCVASLLVKVRVCLCFTSFFWASAHWRLLAVLESVLGTSLCPAIMGQHLLWALRMCFFFTDLKVWRALLTLGLSNTFEYAGVLFLRKNIFIWFMWGLLDLENLCFSISILSNKCTFMLKENLKNINKLCLFASLFYNSLTHSTLFCGKG